MTNESYSGFAQRFNMLNGILIIIFSTTILFLIIPFGFFFTADVFLVVGCCGGLYYALKNKKESQSPLKTGLIVGLTGSVLALLLISISVWTIYSLEFIYLLNYILYYLALDGIMFVLVGLILGYLFGNYFRRKDSGY